MLFPATVRSTAALGSAAYAAPDTGRAQIMDAVPPDGAAEASVKEQPLVRGRSTNDRSKTPVEEPGGVAAPASSSPPTAIEAGTPAIGNNVEKCVNCQYYDRRRARPADGKAPMWGQCRKHSPHLNPVTAKAYVVEGVWPLVRDDDWCGEWRVLTRIAEEPLPETVALASEDAPTQEPAETPAATRPRGAPAASGATASAE